MNHLSSHVDINTSARYIVSSHEINIYKTYKDTRNINTIHNREQRSDFFSIHAGKFKISNGQILP